MIDTNINIDSNSMAGANPPQTGSSPDSIGNCLTGDFTPINKFNNSLPNNINNYQIYSTSDSIGNTKYYYSYENNIQLSKFKPLGFSLILLFFSVYLFYISSKLYNKYFDKRNTERNINFIFYILSLLILIFWILLVFSLKNIPFIFWYFELKSYPEQFVLGIIFSSLLLSIIGIFRFMLLSFLTKSKTNANVTKDIRVSYIGLIAGLLSITASLYTVFYK